MEGRMCRVSPFLYLLLISLGAVVSQGGNDEHLPSTTWTVSTPQRPTVTAVVNTTKWRMVTETSADLATLSVLEHSTLTLICRASYPVFWHFGDQNEGTPVQERICNPYLEQDRKFCLNADDFSNIQIQMPVVREYQSNVTILEFSKNDTGMFTCKSSVPGSQKDLQISVKIDIHSVLTISSNETASIVQTAFDRQQPLPGSTAARFILPVVFAKPPSIRIDYFVAKTNHENRCPTPSIVEVTKRLPRRNPAHGLSFLSPDAEVDTLFITISASPDVYCPGQYQLTIGHWWANGTRSNVIYQFTLAAYMPDGYQSRTANEGRVELDGHSIELNMLQFYEVRMNLVNPSATLKSVQLLAEERALRGTECKATPLLTAKAAETCGVFGFSFFDFGAGNKGLRIFLQVKTSCTLRIQKVSNSSMDDALISSLAIAAFNGDIFGWTAFDLPGAKVISEPQVWGNGAQVFVNDTFLLTCLVPTCHSLGVTWQKDEVTSWPLLNDKVVGSLPGFIPGTQLNVSLYDLHTIEYTVVFQSLSYSHSGKYACGIFRRPDMEQMIKPDMALFEIKVLDPVAPYFAGQESSSETKVMLQDGKAELTCKASGNPKPDLYWEWMPSSESDFVQPNLSVDNETAEVYRPGTYWCVASTKYGEDRKIFSVRQFSYLPLYVAIPAVIIVIVSIAVSIWYLRSRAKQKSFKYLALKLKDFQRDSEVDTTAPLNDQAESLLYNQNYEIDRRQVTLTQKLLGYGEFGRIVKGVLKSADNRTEIAVAVKMPKDAANIQYFRALAGELKIMSNIRPHINVLSLIGACTNAVEQRELLMLTAYCENGSLRDYLIKNCVKFEGFEVNKAGQFIGPPGAVEALLKYAYQAAYGMAHLAACNIIHRDLALRNLLLTSNHIVKIADFGMSRQRESVYHKRFSINTPLPLFWMALESLSSGQYTKQSDVWSFGVVLWEIFSCGSHPYADHDPDIITFRSWLKQSDKNRLGPPSIACDEMYQLMQSCWRDIPESRPSFSDCKNVIRQALQQRSDQAYQTLEFALSDGWLAMSAGAQRLNPGMQNHAENDAYPLLGSVTGRKNVQEANEVASPKRESLPTFPISVVAGYGGCASRTRTGDVIEMCYVAGS